MSLLTPVWLFVQHAYFAHNCRYECEESFTTLNVDIRNHQNLLDSLEQYVKGDLLEGANAYHCEKCNKKVYISENVHVNFNSILEGFNCKKTWVVFSLKSHNSGGDLQDDRITANLTSLSSVCNQICFMFSFVARTAGSRGHRAIWILFLCCRGSTSSSQVSLLSRKDSSLDLDSTGPGVFVLDKTLWGLELLGQRPTYEVKFLLNPCFQFPPKIRF